MGNNSSIDFEPPMNTHFAYKIGVQGRILHILKPFEKEPNNWKETAEGKTAVIKTEDNYTFLIDSTREHSGHIITCNCKFLPGHSIYRFEAINPEEIPLGGFARKNNNSMLGSIFFAGFLLFGFSIASQKK